MRVFKNLNDIGNIQNPVVTTGSFDGVHVGHTAIIKRINRLAREIEGESVLITFDPHPRKVLYPETAGKDLKLINAQREKIELLKRTGLDNLIIIHFTREFSKTTSHDFVKDILVGKLKAKKIVVGFNHHFGHNREGDYEYLYKLGQQFKFDVEEIPQQELHHETVSSTKIRHALLHGDIQKANAYLDHHYLMAGELRKQPPENGKNEFTWYNIEIEEDCKLIPPPGLYAVFIYFKGSQYKGMAEITTKNEDTTHYNHNKVVKVHFMELGEDIHGRVINVFFAKKIRKGIK
ncbi:MAG: hypothetical protein K9I47_11145, partial [Bacteroidales bacterium]|nr:hypothetical protein [Bacteroidales bacterium]